MRYEAIPSAYHPLTLMSSVSGVTILQTMSTKTTIFSDNLSDAWVGRIDGPNPKHALWYTTIQPMPDPAAVPPGAALIGFACDEGVRRNYGRPGAADGPDGIRAAMGWLAVHDEYPRYDAGDIGITGDDMVGAQKELADAVAAVRKVGHLPIVIGGTHEAAFGSYNGLRSTMADDAQPPAIINLDQHLDIRDSDRPTHGTPFRQIFEQEGENFDYTVFGVSPADNTTFNFEEAERMGVRVILDDDLAEATPAEAAAEALQAVWGRETIHLSIDLDVLSAAVAPGVSSPAAVGVPLANIRAICKALAETGKLSLVDVVELNPGLDVDKRTARVAGRLIHEIAAAHMAAMASRQRTIRT